VYTVTFLYEQQNRTPVLIQHVKAGQSLLEVALKNNIELPHQCGGVCYCCTCHVYVDKGHDFLEEKTRREMDFLKKVKNRMPQSRLACQCLLLEGSGSVEVTIPFT
jgi:ferredoxin, 2Fe-2S